MCHFCAHFLAIYAYFQNFVPPFNAWCPHLVGQVAVAQSPLLLPPLAAHRALGPRASVQKAPVEKGMGDGTQRVQKGTQTDERVPVRLEQEGKLDGIDRKTEKSDEEN